MENYGKFDLPFVIKTIKSKTRRNQDFIGEKIFNCLYCPEERDVINFDGTYISKFVGYKKKLDKRIREFISDKQNKNRIIDQLTKVFLPDIFFKEVDSVRKGIIKTFSDAISADPFITKKETKIVKKILKQYEYENLVEYFYEVLCFAALRTDSRPPDEMSFFYLQEVNYRCPCCGKMLIRELEGVKEKKIEEKYTIVQIYPDNPDNEIKTLFKLLGFMPEDLSSFENHIALCKTDGVIYKEDISETIIRTVVSYKQNIQIENKIRDILQNSYISREIIDIIKSIYNNPRSYLSTDYSNINRPISLDDKINSENYLLLDRVRNNIKYYSEINKYFLALSGSRGKTSFGTIQSEMNTLYRRMQDQGITQEQIFDKLSLGLSEKHGFDLSYKYAAEVVVSFFIINCDVF